jgi:hypothetical protein
VSDILREIAIAYAHAAADIELLGRGWHADADIAREIRIKPCGEGVDREAASLRLRRAADVDGG